MRLNELYDEDLVEGPIADRLKRLAAAGAVAGGLGLGGYSALNAPKLPEPTTSVAQKQQDTQTDTKATTAPQTEPEKAEKRVNPNFPKGLTDIDKMTVDQRVHTFIKTVAPLITSENAKITAERNRLIHFVKIIRSGKKLNKEENAWLNGLADKYDEDNIPDLLKKVDIIPTSLAIAQAAIESQWGQDEKTQKGNVFFGQKSWAKTGGVEGPQGERYRAFDRPEDSISEYMHNLNTHDAYEDFRNNRAQMRQKGKPITGLALVGGLKKYADTKGAYPVQLASIIKGRNLQQYDIAKK
jgi:Bax protein